jgi:hypothetical protein
MQCASQLGPLGDNIFDKTGAQIGPKRLRTFQDGIHFSVRECTIGT